MKKTNRIRNLLSALLCLVMIAAIILTFSACNNNPVAVSSAPVLSTEATVVGEGKTEFAFTVVRAGGSEKNYIVKTDSDNVGEALLNADLIAGENGDYGLYVKTVDGTTLNFNTDGMYWAFFIDGEYASTGVDKTTITDGAVYSFKAEK